MIHSFLVSSAPANLLNKVSVPPPLSRCDDAFYDADFDSEFAGELEEIIELPRDSFVDLAKADLKEFFSGESVRFLPASVASNV